MKTNEAMECIRINGSATLIVPAGNGTLHMKVHEDTIPDAYAVMKMSTSYTWVM